MALELAKELPDRFKSLMPKIQTGLFGHYVPYKEAADAGERTGSPRPSVASPEAVWPHVTHAHVLVEPAARTLAGFLPIGFAEGQEEERTGLQFVAQRVRI